MSKDQYSVLDSINKQGMEKLKEMPLALREMADTIERRLKTKPALHDAFYEIVNQLRSLDSHMGLLSESAASSLRDLVRVLEQNQRPVLKDEI